VAALAVLDGGAMTLVTFHAPPRRAAREPQPARQER